MKAQVYVTLKNGVLDPQGEAVGRALKTLGYPQLLSVRQGKFFEVEISESDPEKAKVDLKQMSEKLLANTVMENYRIEIVNK
jgi:phosphoribosylformylglycinamidine synthase PurS subunit